MAESGTRSGFEQQKVSSQPKQDFLNDEDNYGKLTFKVSDGSPVRLVSFDKPSKKLVLNESAFFVPCGDPGNREVRPGSQLLFYHRPEKDRQDDTLEHDPRPGQAEAGSIGSGSSRWTPLPQTKASGSGALRSTTTSRTPTFSSSTWWKSTRSPRSTRSSSSCCCSSLPCCSSLCRATTSPRPQPASPKTWSRPPRSSRK